MSWTNFWTAISGFGGAIIGALISYLCQTRAEKLKDRNERKGVLCKYSLFLDRVFGLSNPLYEKYFKVKKSDTLRHLNIQPVLLSFPEIDIKDPSVELYFLTEYDQPCFIAKMLSFKERYSMFINNFQKRNALIVDQLQTIASENNMQSGKFSPAQVNEIIGRALYGQLESITNLLYEELEYLNSNYHDLRKELTNIFITIYPKAKLLKLTNANE